jgi:antirestriction protein ArdC
MPRNPVTKNPYRGVNTLILWITAQQKGYASSAWASYLQWKSMGAQVREGERGTVIVFYKRLDENPEQEPEGDAKERPRMLLRYSYVFNADQVKDWDEVKCQGDANAFVLSNVDAFIEALRSDRRYGSDSAYYSPEHDRIFMPDRTAFYDTPSGNRIENFYAVLLHEQVHWTGHKSRLARDVSGKFGSESYAMEELVAELGAAFLCAMLGISTSPRPDHAAYLASWLKVLKEERTAIFTAASAATRACEYLMETTEKNKPPEPMCVFNQHPA